MNRNYIPRVEMLNDWPHLEPLRDKLMPVKALETGLLIGYDCSQGLAPQDVILSDDRPEGPFALKTDLGWGIVGMVSPNSTWVDEDGVVSHRILTRSEEGVQIVLPARVKELYSPAECLKMFESDFAGQADTGESSSQDE